MDIKKNEVDHELEQGQGYFLGLGLGFNELEQVRGFVTTHWLETINKAAPSTHHIFEQKGIEQYHEFSNLLDHGSIWSKSSRMFPHNIVQKIRKMSLITNLEKIYGSIEIVDEENLGYEEIDWRLVRPNQWSDIGPLHADSWFCELGHGVPPPPGKKAIKVWVALCCEPGKNGLNVVPHSQKRSWRYHGESRHGFVKPQIDEDETKLNAILVHTKPGDAIVFHDKLLHGGALNKGLFTRVSMEFMVFVTANSIQPLKKKCYS